MIIHFLQVQLNADERRYMNQALFWLLEEVQQLPLLCLFTLAKDVQKLLFAKEADIFSNKCFKERLYDNNYNVYILSR